MTEFVVQEDGLITEKSIHDLANWYAQFTPRGSGLTFEAHLLLLRTYNLLTNTVGPSAAAGLSRSRYNVLRILYLAEGHRLRMSDIGEGLNVSPTNITKLIDSLVNDGLA